MTNMTNHLPRSAGRLIGPLGLGVLVLATLAFDRGACGGPRKERLYVDRPATWFEDIGTSAQISRDGRWALLGRAGHPKLIDLQTGQEDRARLLAGLDEVSRAVFRGESDLVRLGRLGEQRGWFVDEGGALRLVSLPADASPQWSPGGDRVAFRRQGVAALFVGPLDSPARHDVTGRITGLTWSGDGQALYLTVWDDTRGLSTLLRLADGSAELQPVVEGLDAEPFDARLSTSPDGQRVYLALASASDRPPGVARHQPDADRDLDIYEIDLASGDRRPIVQGPGDDFGPVVAGGQLHFTRNDIHESVVVIPAAGGPARLVAERGELPSWAPGGRQIAFTYGGWRIADWALNLDAAVIDVDGDARPVSPPRPIVTGYHEDFTPVWSPDGKWLAYHSHRSATPVASYYSPGSTDDVYLRAATPGGPEIRLTDFGLEVGMADWAPDGRRLVFSSWERGGTVFAGLPWIVTIDPQTGLPSGPARLPLPAPIANAEWLAWSPGGGEIALEEKLPGDRHALWRIAADGSTGERLTEHPVETYGGLDWSPDGETLVYAARAGGRLQLFSIPRAGGSPRRLSDDAANLLHPQVSPDGAWIAATRFQVTKEIRRTALP